MTRARGFLLRAMLFLANIAWLAAVATGASVVLSGVVLTADGRPIAGARITVRAGTTVVTATSDRDGRFEAALRGATAVLSVSAAGFVSSAPQSIDASALERPLQIRLVPASQTIGTIVARSAPPRVTDAAQATLTASQALGAGALRLGDALVQLPGFSAVDAGSSVSDDLYLSLRGFKPSDVLTMLNGHPIGPVGVSPDMAAGFNYQNAPLFALQGATVTYGTGPSGDYAYDAFVGSVDLQTLTPTRTAVTTLAQSVGSQARASTLFTATDMMGAVGYALAYGVQGTSGNFAPQTIAQTGLRGSDFTSATLAALTYPVSANAVLRNALATIRLPAGTTTSISLTGYSATSWVDKTGVDDNDFYPYAYQLARAENNLGGALVSGGAACPPTLVPTIDDAHTNPAQPACITPDAFAAGSSGPAGGGPGAYQTIRQIDDALHAVSHLGAHTLTLDGYIDDQTTALVRPASFVQATASDDTTQLLGSGFAFGDVVPVGVVSLAAGISALRQALVSDGTGGAALSEAAAYVYLRGSPARNVTVAGNLMVKHFGGLAQTVADPQVTITYRPDASTSVRFLAGAASAEPQAAARGGAPVLISPGDLDPGNCAAFTIGTAPNPDVTSERANDVELSASRRFGAATFTATGYLTSVTGEIFGAGAPLATIPGFTVASPGLAGFYDRVRSVCPGTYGGASDAQIFDALNVEQPINVARTLGRGLAFAASVAITRSFSLAGTYDVTSLRRFDIPASVLALPSNVTIVDGGQVAGIPLQQASVTLAHTNAHGISGELSAYYNGPNNNRNLPGYAYADVALHAPVGRGLRLDVAVTNAFNSHADIYGRVGLGLFIPENAYGTDTNALDAGTERYGLAPAAVTVTLTGRLGR